MIFIRVFLLSSWFGGVLTDHVEMIFVFDFEVLFVFDFDVLFVLDFEVLFVIEFEIFYETFEFYS